MKLVVRVLWCVGLIGVPFVQMSIKYGKMTEEIKEMIANMSQTDKEYLERSHNKVPFLSFTSLIK